MIAKWIFLRAVGAALSWSLPTFADADSVAVPASLQAKLTAKLAAFDDGFRARAGASATLMIVIRDGDPISVRFGQELMAALRRTETVGGLPHLETPIAYSDASALAAAVRAQHPSIVYLAAGLSGEAHEIGEAMKGLDVLTVTAEPMAVALGVIVGFDLVSNQPKIVVNLRQAKAQNVRLSSALLRLASITGA
jgi:hypothetical protein